MYKGTYRRKYVNQNYLMKKNKVVSERIFYIEYNIKHRFKFRDLETRVRQLTIKRSLWLLALALSSVPPCE